MPFIITDPNGTLLVSTIFHTRDAAEYEVAEKIVYIEDNFPESVLRNEIMNTIKNNHRIKEIELVEKFDMQYYRWSNQL